MKLAVRWALTIGPVAKDVRERAQYGHKVPDNFWPPEMPPGVDVWLETFWELSTDRPLGFEKVGPIPAASIDRHVVGWEPYEAAVFRRVIRAADWEFLQVTNKVNQAPPVSNPEPLREPEAPTAPELANPARDAFRNAFRK